MDAQEAKDGLSAKLKDFFMEIDRMHCRECGGFQGNCICYDEDGSPNSPNLPAATRLSPQPETAQGERRHARINCREHPGCGELNCDTCHPEPSQQENAPQPQQDKEEHRNGWHYGYVTCSCGWAWDSRNKLTETMAPQHGLRMFEKHLREVSMHAPSQPQPAESDGVREHIAGLEQRLYDEQQSHQSTMRTLIAAEAKLSSLLAQKPEETVSDITLDTIRSKWTKEDAAHQMATELQRYRQLFKDAEKGQGK